MTDSSQPTIVVGIDGAHFELINPWLESGELPNFSKLIEAGVVGDLESVLPPVTSPNWKAYSTGKNPGKFGIFWWENVDTSNNRIYYPSERKQSTTEFWEILAQGYNVGVIGVPTTYPPKSVGEFYISGAPDGKNSGFAYPQELEQELIESYGYQVTIDHQLQTNKNRATKDIINQIDTRFEVARDLFGRFDLDFLQVTTFYINSLHHFLWDDRATLEAWKTLDKHLGFFINCTDANIIVMSDHGSNKINYEFNINTWLESEGYLHCRSNISDFLYRFGLDIHTASHIASYFGVRDLAKKHLPRRLIRVFPDKDGEVKQEGKENAINWDKSDAMGSGQGPVYILHEQNQSGFELVREEIIQKLESLETPQGKPVADSVYRGENIYSGDYISEAPSIVIDQARRIHINGNIGADCIFRPERQGKWRAENKRNGIFIASGPAFDNKKVGTISILDLAPTLLHMHGIEIPRDMDGRVRKEIYIEESPPKQTQIKYTEPIQPGETDQYTDTDELQERLEDLGYL